MKTKLILLFLAITCIANAQLTVLHVFNDTAGKNPCGSLTLVGSKLYGLAEHGGVNNEGCIFSLDTNGSNYKVLFYFNGINGANPYFTQLTYFGKKLYGMTMKGGTYNAGCVFSLDTDGNNYKDIYSFNGAIGDSPMGSLTISGSKLYGMAIGGTYVLGTIFSMDTNGSNYKKILDFNDTNGANPYGNLALFNNVLYGMTYGGGKYNIGLIFSIDTNGNNYKKLLDFDNTNGASPLGSLTLAGNTLYGMTNREGGSHDYGNIFSIDTNGDNYKNLLNFNGTDGGFPFGSVIVSGNSLYGMTVGGGPSDAGSIFSIDTNGNKFSNLFVFDSAVGSSPYGSLVLSGNILYGVTSGGALDNNGIIFAFKDTIGGLGINELKGENETIKVYPNPSNGVFALSCHSERSEESNPMIEIYNVLGAKVYSQFIVHGSSFIVNLSAQPNGVYLYRIISENGNLVGEGKLVIQR